MKQFLGLLLGLIIGTVGAVLFVKSMPPEKGSAEEQVLRLAAEMEKIQRKNVALEAEGHSDKPKRSMRDNMRSIAEDIKAGRTVDLDDVFAAAKPWMRDMAPLFDRMRVRDQKAYIDSKTGELTREYKLTESQQEELKKWFERKAEENAERFTDVINSDQTGMEDMIRASRDIEGNGLGDEGLDSVMETMLQGDDLEKYKQDRLVERVNKVQNEADRKVTRLDSIVSLDEDQKDAVFGIMVRGSANYDPEMQLEGIGNDTGALAVGSSREEAIQAVLTTEQQQAYNNHFYQRRHKEERELQAVGLSLPPDWDLYDEDDF